MFLHSGFEAIAPLTERIVTALVLLGYQPQEGIKGLTLLCPPLGVLGLGVCTSPELSEPGANGVLGWGPPHFT